MPRENRISVITTVFNGEKTIEHSILSVLKQAYTNVELIIVDGLSADGTMDIVRRYARIDDRIKYLSEKDTGIYNAFNKGIQMSSGDIVIFINSDDFLASNALQKINKNFDINTKSIFAGGLTIINSNEKYSKKIYRSRIKEFSVTNPSVLTIGVSFKKEVFHEIGYFDDSFRICADVDFIYRCLKRGVKIQYSDVLISFMREGGISSNPKYEVLKKKEQLRAHIKNTDRLDLTYAFTLMIKLTKTLLLNTLFKSSLVRRKRMYQDLYIDKEVFWFIN